MPTPKLLSFFGVVGLSLFLVTSSRAGVPVVVDVFPPTNSVVSALTQIEVFFSEDVQGVDASDFLVNGVAATDVTLGLPNQALFRFTKPVNGTVTITWAAGHGIQDLSLVPNDFGGGGWTYVLDPTIAPTAAPALIEAPAFCGFESVRKPVDFTKYVPDPLAAAGGTEPTN